MAKLCGDRRQDAPALLLAIRRQGADPHDLGVRAQPRSARTSAGQSLLLGQRKVADRSNEVAAIPQLLEVLTINGATITIDAMECQRALAAKIMGKDADPVLALKGNQRTLRGGVEPLVGQQNAANYRESAIERRETIEMSHGRVAARIITATREFNPVETAHKRPGLKSIVTIESGRENAERCARKSGCRIFPAAGRCDAEAEIRPDVARIGLGSLCRGEPSATV